MEQNTVVIIAALKQIVQHVYYHDDDDLGNKKLNPIIGQVNKIEDAEQWKNKDDGPDDIIG